jgi:signal transduction histidine kinase
VMDRIVRMALQTVEGRGAYIEQIVAESSRQPDTVIVRASAGIDTPPIDTVHRLEDSHTSRVALSGTPVLIPGATELRSSEEHQQASGAVIVVPLGTTEARVGALFVLSPSRGRFRADDVEQAATFGHLASLALEKVRILDAAHEGRRKLERVLKSRSRLMRGFSHDVKNPVGAADGYAALLSDGVYGALSSKQLESVTRIRRSIHGALTLIDDLHELASAETGNLALTVEPVDINELLATMVEEYQAAAGSAGLALIMTTDGQLAPVPTSRVRVQQIVSNLLSNAIKYTPRGAVTVRALPQSPGWAQAPGNWVVVSVSDTGPGIPPDQQEYIFEEFSRIGPRDKSGAGLGLAISRLLAQALGGQISVDSVVGNGSTFNFALRWTSSPLQSRTHKLAS